MSDEKPKMPEIRPGDLVIRTTPDRILVIVRENGDMEFGPDYDPDEAARAFWDAMIRQRVLAQDQLLLMQHMEGLLTRIGAQDIRTENLRKMVQKEEDPVRKAELQQYAELSIRQLETMVHQAVELGRGLSRRPDTKMVSIPKDLPRAFQDIPETAYTGRDGMPAEDVCGECGAIAPAGADLCLECEAKYDQRTMN